MRVGRICYLVTARLLGTTRLLGTSEYLLWDSYSLYALFLFKEVSNMRLNSHSGTKKSIFFRILRQTMVNESVIQTYILCRPIQSTHNVLRSCTYVK